ncbi:helix-turn-helix domain-containing protein [Formosa sp. S-31]|uniref:helix-turn-helix transcriptional regulator n=1 Tax=Formosa sp. S-31 TaxID=2790949 RepID=UPI003EBFCEDC
MLLQSYFKELNTEFYNIDLLQNSAQNELKNTSVNIKTSDYDITSEIYHGQHFCIINTRRCNEKLLTEHVNITGPYVLIAYLISGDMSIKYKEARTKAQVDYGKLNILCGDSINNKVKVPANKETESILIYIKHSYFISLLQQETWSKNHAVFSKIITADYSAPHIASLVANFHIHSILKGIMLYYKAEHRKSYFLELKVRELFLAIEDSLAPPLKKELLHLDKIQSAKVYIDKHYLQTPTIKVISRYILLNEMQLKNDFKKVYGITIRAYIIELKLKKALQLLKTNTVEDVSTQLGYKSVSHFITIFKNHYGKTPSKS